jgi:hypothetical protein
VERPKEIDISIGEYLKRCSPFNIVKTLFVYFIFVPTDFGDLISVTAIAFSVFGG